MRYGAKMAWRQLWSTPGQTALLIAGVAAAVFIFIFMSALIGGLAELLINRTIGNLAHVSVEAPERSLPILIEQPGRQVLAVRQVSTQARLGLSAPASWENILQGFPQVKVIAPKLVGGGVLIRGDMTRQVAINGLEPGRETAIIHFDRGMVTGSRLLRGDSLMIGKKLADDLGVGLGKTLTLRADNGNETTLTISGLFSLGLSQLDENSAFIEMGTAQALLDRPGRVSVIELRLADLYAAPAVAPRIHATTGLDATPWTETNEQLFEALKAQANTGSILKVFAMITVVIGIASALMLTTFRRRSEIGIMRAFGAKRRFILYVFVLQGSLIGLAGGLAGAVLAIAALSPFPPIDQVQPGQLPVDLRQGAIGLAILLTTLGATLAALLPARSASRLDPVEAIQQ
ncbi:MAG: ABC transporter permease [bacterium]